MLSVTAFILGGCATVEHQAELEPLPDVADTGPLDELPQPDIWDRLRDGMAIPDHDHEATSSYRDWYSRNQSYLERVASRAEPYLYFILEEIEARDLPTELALLPVIESAYYPFAYSHGRAAGMWQFIPATGRIFGMRQDWWYDGRRDVHAATRGALEYLSRLHDQFDDWHLALAAYNAGSGNVRRAQRLARSGGRDDDYWSVREFLPRETRGYVPKLLAIAGVVDDPESHAVSLPSIPNEPRIARVDTGSQLDLALAADLAGIDVDAIYRLNPGFNRWATSPNGPHELFLPVNKVGEFKRNLAELPPEERLGWQRHRIRSGESLETIARDYNTTVDMLRRVNNLNSHVIRAGHHLMIPVAVHEESQYTLTEEARTRAIQQRSRNGRKITHTVRAGDSFWELARRHKVSVRELASWNNMAPGDPLREGQQLVIWSRADVTARIPTNFSAPHSYATERRVGYTVRVGDSLARVAQRFNVSVSQLRQWNNLEGEQYLQPGQRLTLYVDVTNQAS
ncbi:MAG: LysM peptidoglycan-binding domain-containing protein [Pseudomonadota bacterium]